MEEMVIGWMDCRGRGKRLVDRPFESDRFLTKSCGEGSGVNGIF